jgi:hypothetical protein
LGLEEGIVSGWPQPCTDVVRMGVFFCCKNFLTKFENVTRCGKIAAGSHKVLWWLRATKAALQRAWVRLAVDRNPVVLHTGGFGLSLPDRRATRIG